ncbi:DUF6221 family protein [Streptomyces sp. NPDC052043]|uniref:DUF6221 family protein n=1 Tax=Streptomyces sp. NPDC052043 TaxID=3365684 RepID=UPI0037D7CF52
MTDTLPDWLHAQLDEDEQIARRAGDSFRQVGETGVIVATEGDRAEECASANWAGIAEHIAEHDPAQVLREIDAKRRTLERHSPHSSGSVDCSMRCERAHPGVQVCNHDGRRWPCPDVIDLASVYSGRPGYREEWRP